APDDLGLPELCMVLSDTLVIFDNLRQTIKVVATAHVPRPERAAAAYDGAVARIDRLIARLRGEAAAPLAPLEPPPLGEAGTARLRWGGEAPTSSFAEADFLAAVERARAYVAAGDVFQVVLSQRLAVPRAGVDPFDAYRALRLVNPS